MSLFSEVSIGDLSNNDVWSRQDIDSAVVFTKRDSGKVPVLCFHKIGSEARYELTAENFESFLIYLNDNNFYPLSDKEFINRDFSRVPTGYTPIVLGSDDASEGNFEYKTVGSDSVNGIIDDSSGDFILKEDSMVFLLEKYLKPSNGVINFTFYIAFNGIPFRQTGGMSPRGKYYRGIDIIGVKFNYLLDHFIVGIHTITHPVTKNTSVVDFKWEIDEFYAVMESYVGDRIRLIDTIAYPYGCADLKPDMRSMLSAYSNNGSELIGGFDFDGYFSRSPLSGQVDNYDISRLGVDNQNIKNVYGFLEHVRLFNTERVIVVKDRADLEDIEYNSDDLIMVGTV